LSDLIRTEVGTYRLADALALNEASRNNVGPQLIKLA